MSKAQVIKRVNAACNLGNG